MFNEGNNLFGEACKVLLEAAAERSVFSGADCHVDFDAHYNEGFHILLQNQLPGQGSNPAEVEEFFTVLAVDDGIAEYFIISGGR